MVVLHRDKSGFFAAVEAEGRSIRHRLSVEGARFLTEILSLRDGDEVRPKDWALLVERGWAEPEPEPEPAPEPPPPPPAGQKSPARAPEAPPRRAEPPRAANVRRTRSREIALQVLYLMEQNPATDPGEIERFIVRRLRDAKLREFSRELVAGVREHQPRLDALISEAAENWRLDRMAAIDRNILRLGAYEMLCRDDVPRKVAINEALELAKRYSTAQSSRFVNGILDRLQANDAGAPPAPAEPAADAEPTPAPEPEPPGPEPA